MKYLLDLSKEILKNVPEGLTKVKFAKTIYFVHKGLVKDEFSKQKELRFIRMPLGPVPSDYKNLAFDSDILVSEKKNSRLLYNTQVYKLKNYNLNTGFSIEQIKKIKNLVKQLNKFNTAELVEHSHLDPSWLNHINGEVYYISEDDLKNEIPCKGLFKNIFNINTAEDDVKLQGKLVEGMIDDIVQSSTSLEYPKK